MNKYILVAFALMGVVFYELSGGSDFEPGSNSITVFAEPKPVVSDPEPALTIVARADTTVAGLTDIAQARTLIEPIEKEEPVNTVDVSEPESDPTPVVEVAATEVQPVEEPRPDLRFVDGDRVNVRGGPGTDYAVVGQLIRNDMIEVLKDEGNGWLHLRDTVTGDEGWVAEWLVTAAN